MHHIWARGEWGMHCGSKGSPLPCGRNMVPIKKSMVLSMVYPFSWPEKLNQFLLCRQFKSNKNWELMRIQEKVFKNSQRAIFILKHFFLSQPPSPPPLHPDYSSKKHHLPWKHFWPMYTQQKKLFFPMRKKPCPCVTCTHPAAQFPATIPDMSEHSSEVWQVPLRVTPFLII